MCNTHLKDINNIHLKDFLGEILLEQQCIFQRFAQLILNEGKRALISSRLNIYS